MEWSSSPRVAPAGWSRSAPAGPQFHSRLMPASKPRWMFWCSRTARFWWPTSAPASSASLVPQTAPITLLPQLHILHAATNLEGAVAPGEIVSVYGSGFFGDCSLTGRAGRRRGICTSEETQINAVLPNELPARRSRGLPGGLRRQDRRAKRRRRLSPRIQACSPTTGGRRRSNEDGTVNSSANPATQG